MGANAQTLKTPMKPGRRPGFDRAVTVAAIADLFWAKGYDGVAISDVMAATGLSKSSLYNSFGDKDDLFRIALAHYHAGVVEAGAEWLAADDGTDPWDKLAALLSGPGEDAFGRQDRRGCFLCNTASDGPGGAPGVDELVGQGFDRLTDGLSALLSRAAPTASADTVRATARTVLTAYVGMRVRSRHARTRDALDSVAETLITLARASVLPNP